jgi:hypothetical protein
MGDERVPQWAAITVTPRRSAGSSSIGSAAAKFRFGSDFSPPVWLSSGSL